MLNVLKKSVTYRLIAAIAAWFGGQWRDSTLIGRFTRGSRARAGVEHSVFSRLWRLFHRGLCRVFEALRLNRLLAGSIFCMPYLWCTITLALAPLLPTMAVLVLAAASVLSLFLAFGTDRGRVLQFSPMNRFIFLYALVYIAAVFASVTVSGSIYGGALTVLFVLFTIVVQNSVRSRRQFDALVAILVLAGALVAAYGLYQYVFGAFGAAAWVDSDMFSGITTRVYSTLENPNVLSEYLLLVIPLAAAAAITAKRPFLRLVFICALAAMLLCMVLTFARGGWLGLILSAAIFLVMLDRRFILLGIVGLVALYFVLPDVVLDRFLSIGNLKDSSTSYRLSILLGTITMLKTFWFTGIGPGTAAFNKVYPLYSYGAAAAQHAHNLYLQIMCDAGICGIVLFGMILFTYFRTVCSAMHKETDKSSRIYQIAAVSAVAGFLVQGLGDYSFYNYRVTLLFWAVLGVGALAARRSSLEVPDA